MFLVVRNVNRWDYEGTEQPYALTPQANAAWPPAVSGACRAAAADANPAAAANS